MNNSTEAEFIESLIVKVRTMVAESGNEEGFDAELCLMTWLSSPLPALGGRRPDEYLDTAERRATIAQLLAMTQSGAYA